MHTAGRLAMCAAANVTPSAHLPDASCVSITNGFREISYAITVGLLMIFLARLRKSAMAAWV